MINLLVLIALGGILLACSLKLETETTHRGSKEYNSLRNWGITGLGLSVTGWLGLMVIGLFI